MKVSISNIAWPVEQDRAVAECLSGMNVKGVEIAPTKIWPDPTLAKAAEIDAYRRLWEAQGISIVAAQSLLFGHPELTLFDGLETRSKTLDYLRGIVELCGRLGAQALVFGSPKNRLVGSRNRLTAWGEAIDFFGQLAEIAEGAGTRIVMEANPPEYGADFVVRGSEALALVQAVDHPGFQLHLDSACMTLAGDDPNLITEAGGTLAHFHASEPFLAPVGTGPINHSLFADQLATVDFQGWVSIEMRQQDPFDLSIVANTVRNVQRLYQSK